MEKKGITQDFSSSAVTNIALEWEEKKRKKQERGIHIW